MSTIPQLVCCRIKRPTPDHSSLPNEKTGNCAQNDEGKKSGLKFSCDPFPSFSFIPLFFFFSFLSPPWDLHALSPFFLPFPPTHSSHSPLPCAKVILFQGWQKKLNKKEKTRERLKNGIAISENQPGGRPRNSRTFCPVCLPPPPSLPSQFLPDLSSSSSSSPLHFWPAAAAAETQKRSAGNGTFNQESPEFKVASIRPRPSRRLPNLPFSQLSPLPCPTK